MAEKHKSKYKAPKDFEKSQTIKARKDLKDYTSDDVENMVPNSVKGIVPLVPRKTDKMVIDDVENMVPEIKHRIYAKVESGEYSPAEARKIFKKLQIEDTEGYLDAMEGKEEKSPLEEAQIRKYIRNKISKIFLENKSSLYEQTDTTPAPAPEADTTPEPAPAPEPAPVAEPDSTDNNENVIDDFVNLLNKEVGVVGKLKLLFKVIKSVTKDAEEIDRKNLLRLLIRTGEKQYHTPTKKEND